MLAILILIAKLISVHSVVLNPNGPVHQNYATRCIMQIAESQFVENNKLLTILTTQNLSTPGFGIQNKVIREINNSFKWLIETVSGKRHEFQSSEICTNCPVKDGEEEAFEHNFQLQYKTTYCVMIVDNYKQFKAGLHYMLKSKSYNFHCYFFVYVSEVRFDFENTTERFLQHLWHHKIFDSAVMMPRNSLSTFAIYGLDVYAPSKYCGESPLLTLLDTCKKGDVAKNNTLFGNKLPKTFHNCSIKTIAMKYPPFVISKEEGFEIKILRELGKILDIHFDIKIEEDAADWGNRISSNNWSGPLEHVYKESAIAIGNIVPKPDYSMDFDLSIEYFNEHMVWVVPAALPIPRWKNLFVIFTYELWLATIAFYVLVSILLWVLSRVPDELSCYKTLSLNFLTALEVLLGVAVHKQPVTYATRAVFISVAVYGIVIVVMYQSLLMSHLLEPVYERELYTLDDILSTNMGIGGIKSYREFFNVSNDQVAERVFDMFEVYDEVNDTAYDWLLTVADDRDTCTISSRFYVDYLLGRNDSDLTNDQGLGKIAVLHELIFAYPVRMILPRGFPLGRLFDKVIWKLLNGGIVNQWANLYRTHLHQALGGSDEDTVLTVRHLQGAFAILLIGYAFSLLALILEIITHRVCTTKFKKFVLQKLKK